MTRRFTYVLFAITFSGHVCAWAYARASSMSTDAPDLALIRGGDSEDCTSAISWANCQNTFCDDIACNWVETICWDDGYCYNRLSCPFNSLEYDSDSEQFPQFCYPTMNGNYIGCIDDADPEICGDVYVCSVGTDPDPGDSEAAAQAQGHPYCSPATGGGWYCNSTGVLANGYDEPQQPYEDTCGD